MWRKRWGVDLSNAIRASARELDVQYLTWSCKPDEWWEATGGRSELSPAAVVLRRGRSGRACPPSSFTSSELSGATTATADAHVARQPRSPS